MELKHGRNGVERGLKSRKSAIWDQNGIILVHQRLFLKLKVNLSPRTSLRSPTKEKMEKKKKKKKGKKYLKMLEATRSGGAAARSGGA